MNDKKIEEIIYPKKIIKPIRIRKKKQASSVKITNHSKHIALKIKVNFDGE